MRKKELTLASTKRVAQDLRPTISSPPPPPPHACMYVFLMRCLHAGRNRESRADGPRSLRKPLNSKVCITIMSLKDIACLPRRPAPLPPECPQKHPPLPKRARGDHPKAAPLDSMHAGGEQNNNAIRRPPPPSDPSTINYSHKDACKVIGASKGNIPTASPSPTPTRKGAEHLKLQHPERARGHFAKYLGSLCCWARSSEETSLRNLQESRG